MEGSIGFTVTIDGEVNFFGLPLAGTSSVSAASVIEGSSAKEAKRR